MDRRLKQKKDLLEKVFAFLKVDLGALSTMEKKAIIDEMLPFFLDPFYPQDDKSKLSIDFLDPFNKRTGFEENLIQHGVLSHVQNETKNALNDLVTKGHGQKVFPLVGFPMVKDGVITYLLVPLAGRDTNPMNFFTPVFLANVNRMLDGIPHDSLKICPDCGGYFLNLTRRKKDYCSPHCTWRALAKQKREEIKKHPRKYAAYKKKQAKLMWEKYPERVKDQKGLKKVKISRRVQYGPKGKTKIRKED